MKLSEDRQNRLIEFVNVTDTRNHDRYCKRGQVDPQARKLQNLLGKYAELYVNDLIHADYEDEILDIGTTGSFSPDIVCRGKNLSIKSQMPTNKYPKGRFSFSNLDPILTPNSIIDYVVGLYFPYVDFSKSVEELVKIDLGIELICFSPRVVMEYAVVEHDCYPKDKILLDASKIKTEHRNILVKQ